LAPYKWAINAAKYFFVDYVEDSLEEYTGMELGTLSSADFAKHFFGHQYNSLLDHYKTEFETITQELINLVKYTYVSEGIYNRLVGNNTLDYWGAVTEAYKFSIIPAGMMLVYRLRTTRIQDSVQILNWPHSYINIPFEILNVYTAFMFDLTRWVIREIGEYR
jgi:hypothetical protein